MTDQEVIVELKAAVADERRSIVRVLRALRTFDERRLAREEAKASTFEYCTKVLGYAESAAYKRVSVARLTQRLPELLPMIETGRITLSVATILMSALQEPNGSEVLRKAAGMSAAEARIYAVTLSHRPPVVRSVIAAVPIAAQAPATASDLFIPAEAVLSPTPAAPAMCLAETPPVEVGIRYHFTVRREVHDLFLRARDLSRHRRPAGQPEEIFEDALQALLDDLDRDRKKKAAPERDVLPDRRRIPEWVKDVVWKRDAGRCAWRGKDGGVCGSTAWLEFDHVTPFAHGGASDDPANVRLLCRAHNLHEADRRGLGRPSAESPIDMPVGGE